MPQRPAASAPESLSTSDLAGTSSEESQIVLRLEKAEELRKRGIDPFGNGLEIEHSTADVIGAHGKQSAEELNAIPSEDKPRYVLGGRVVELRRMGKLAFLRLQDRDGALQIMLRKDVLGDSFQLLSDALIDRGDFVRVVGEPIVTRTGELSLAAAELSVLTKSLRPLPEKWHGLADVELRYRRRYVDLVATPGVREIFQKRARIISGIRRFLDERDYVEVETPILHDLAGGAAAKPFHTHHNALDLPLQLRIATELHLKRLVVGGLERVYEIGRIFRNEGVSRRHNPEFTSIEFYQAHATYKDLITLTEELLEGLAKDVVGSVEVPWQGSVINFSAPFARVSMVAEVGRYFAQRWDFSPPEGQLDSDDASAWLDVLAPHLDALRGACILGHSLGSDRAVEEVASKQACLAALEKPGAADKAPVSLGQAVADAFEYFCEGLIDVSRPAFVLDFPIEVSPLARKRDGDGRLVDRFELYAGGMELANAFSELNDPVDQRERFKAQVEAARRGDEEAMPYDEDFVRALEHGMPPTAGEGIGIDRLCMLLTDSPSIREVLLFPLLRPEQKSAPEKGEKAVPESDDPQSSSDNP